MKRRIPTQEERLLAYLDAHGSITMRQAFLDLGIGNVSSVISRINKKRREQLKRCIHSGRISVRNRYGQKCRVAEYTPPPKRIVQGELFNTQPFIDRRAQ